MTAKTAPTQRPAATSDARKRLAEKAPAEPDADERLRERAEAFLVQCGACDAGLPMGCACHDADPRPVIAELLDTLASRTPDARLAATKAEALEEAADELVHNGPGVNAELRHDGTPDTGMAGYVEGLRDAWSLLRARAARLREQGGE